MCLLFGKGRFLISPGGLSHSGAVTCGGGCVELHRYGLLVSYLVKVVIAVVSVRN